MERLVATQVARQAATLAQLPVAMQVAQRAVMPVARLVVTLAQLQAAMPGELQVMTLVARQVAEPRAATLAAAEPPTEGAVMQCATASTSCQVGKVGLLTMGGRADVPRSLLHAKG